jgi:hypothetical protein
MGAFYGSVLIRTDKADAVQSALVQVAKSAKCKFLLGPARNGWISVFPDDSGQNDNISANISRLVPADIFHLIVHDDDLFAYFFYRAGQLVDQYNSCPDYFDKVSDEEKQKCRGRPELFQDLFADPESFRQLQALLAAGEESASALESERLAQFAKLLGLPNALCSYEYLQSGEREGISGWNQFIHIPDLSAEKAARRAAKSQLAAEKKRLKKDGLLLTEIKSAPPPRPHSWPSVTWATDSAGQGLVLQWQSFGRPVDGGAGGSELLTIQSPWDAPPQSTGLKTDWISHVLRVSPSGKWLAAGLLGRASLMRVWDWRRRELAFDVTSENEVRWISFSQNEQWIYSLQCDDFVVISMAEQRPVSIVAKIGHAGRAAVHPAGQFVAVALQNHIGIIDLETKQLVKKLWVGKKVERTEVFPESSDERLIQALLKSHNIRGKLGLDLELYREILQNPKAIEQLSVEARTMLAAMVKNVRFNTRETWDHIFDVCFDTDGKRLGVATSKGTRVFEWGKLLASDQHAPPPDALVDGPKIDGQDYSAYMYEVCYDPQRNIFLAGGLSGVIQYLNANNGQSGILLKLLEKPKVRGLELTRDGQALCCHCVDPSEGRDLDRHYLQVWNYPALCHAAGLS